MGCAIRKRGVILQQNFAAGGSRGIFRPLLYVLSNLRAGGTVPWEVGEGGRGKGQETRIFPPGKPFLPVGRVTSQF